MPAATVDDLLDAEDWGGARTLLRQQLSSEPESHRLLALLASTYYEERDYERALAFYEEAMRFERHCPLVRWGYANALHMLGRHEEAILSYSLLILRGPESIAADECGEGIARARGMVADSHFRASRSLDALGRKVQADGAFIAYLHMRGPHCFCIYPLDHNPTVGEHLIGRRRRTRRSRRTA